MVKRSFTKSVLIETLKPAINEAVPDILLSISASDTQVFLTLSRNPTPQEDATIQDIVNNNVPTDSFIEEQERTNQRNAEGFVLYKKIFAHISDQDAVTNIDGFIAASEYIHRLRNYLKDGNFETALRYFAKYVRPLNMFLFQDMYREWIREIVVKYRPELAQVNPEFNGTPYEGWTGLRYIEEAESA